MKKVLSIVISVSLMSFVVQAPLATAKPVNNWKNTTSGIGFGSLPKSPMYGTAPASFSGGASFSDSSDGITPSMGGGEAGFIKGNESGTTTMVNFELPYGQYFVPMSEMDCDRYWLDGYCFYPIDFDFGGAEYSICPNPPSSASVSNSGRTLSVKIDCGTNQGFGAIWNQGSYLDEGSYEAGIVFKTNTTKRSLNSMFKIKMPEFAYVGYGG